MGPYRLPNVYINKSQHKCCVQQERKVKSHSLDRANAFTVLPSTAANGLENTVSFIFKTLPVDTELPQTAATSGPEHRVPVTDQIISGTRACFSHTNSKPRIK